MKRLTRKPAFLIVAAVAGWLGNGQFGPTAAGSFMASAEARLGRPATPVSVAGVARRSTVREAAYHGDAVGPLDDGIGGPASGIGVLPGAGAGRAGVDVRGGVGVNTGGPVNRVGVR